MIKKYIANIFNGEKMIEVMHSNHFLRLLSDLLNRLEKCKDLTHGFIRNSQTGCIKITCRKKSQNE